MDLLQIVLTSIFSLVALFLLTKLMGKKEMAHFTMFDYINGITIGSIAAEMATAEEEFLKPLTALIVYAAATIIISVITNKSIKARRIITGKSVILMNNGKLFMENMKSQKMDLNEFLTQARSKGYFNLSDIEFAVLEANGSISFMPKADKRPLTPYDNNVKVPQDKPQTNVIVDGRVLERNLKSVGKDIKWLKSQLAQNNIKSIEDTALAFCDNDSELTAFEHLEERPEYDIFE